MGYSCNRLICVAPVNGTAALFLNTSHPKKVHRDYASPDGSTKWSDLADRVTAPCLVFNVVDLTAPSSLSWISIILLMGHLTHAVPCSCMD
ncbi:hypothetical protein T12_15766 [Trichinella patagoniensis]|uniref:Uncharacterized protein n=1 Tax=Trichinella patagoniensis TaxID=990121 RepID=A0A0V0ZRQ2_9BILA|nr:hypothetical protein T12_15766 [Trichinella patagoniensis]